MSKKEHWLIILAGPNGAGKSTFYNNILKTDPLLKNAEYINLDEYAKELAGRSDPADYFIPAGRLVRKKISKNLKENKSFIYETTASGLSHLKIMDQAREKGYKIATVFIGLSRVELSHLRVKKRVNEGGHSVPAEDIERRFPRVIKNFPDMLARSDLAAVFDNSGSEPYRLIFLMDKFNFKIFYKYPKWVEKALENRKTRKDFKFVNTNDLKENKSEQLKKITEMLFGNDR